MLVMVSFVLLACLAIVLALVLPFGAIALPLLLTIPAVALAFFLAVRAVLLALLLAFGAILLTLLLPLRCRRAVLGETDAAGGEQAADGGGKQSLVHVCDLPGWRHLRNRARILNPDLGPGSSAGV